jgi:hypothetical protein
MTPNITNTTPIISVTLTHSYFAERASDGFALRSQFGVRVTCSPRSRSLTAFSTARFSDRTDDLRRLGRLTELILQLVSKIFHESFAFSRLRLSANDDRR